MTDILKESLEICEKYKIKPKRENGQNFLIEEEAYEDIVRAAELSREDTVLEVGPGLGFLTRRLAKQAGQVVTVEIDQEIHDMLSVCFHDEAIDNIQLIREDVLNLDKNIDYNKVVANLPYNISSHFLYQFLSKRDKAKVFVLMLQKEVVERICAVPGNMSILAVSVQYYARAEIIRNVGKDSFYPAPRVESAVLKLVRKDESEIDRQNEKEFFRLVKVGFSSKRKMLKNNLSGGYQISQKEAEDLIIKAGLKNTARAQELSLSDWESLLNIWKNKEKML